ncbi:MAG TPA: hypothetical protein VFA29_09800, partial [Candidatus Baltobacteraceae bacterium]|nr:hypothetical protein [Candidatus Baltobacteraceae bacterium]
MTQSGDVSAYAAQAAELDAEILACIERRHVDGFDDLAMQIFRHQLRYNAPYAKYCAARGVTLDCPPATWEEIPPVPAAAYKEAALCTFPPERAALVFETSGTTQGVGGKHYMETAQLYDAALLAGFRDAMLEGAPGRMRYLLMVPNPAERPHSSLGYMMQKVAQTLGDGAGGWFLCDDALDASGLAGAVRRAVSERVPVCIAGTAFAFVQLLDDLRALGVRRLPLEDGSRIMETGGFKGRTRIVQREHLYRELATLFGVTEDRIVAEYGMTELTSQYYDRAGGAASGLRVKYPPPWMRARVVGVDGATLPAGIVGALAHIDLANRSSCIAV